MNKDIYQIFEAYNTESVDTTAIKKRYDDGLKAITDAGLSPKDLTSAKNALAQQWQSERQELGADAGGQDLQELDTISDTQLIPGKTYCPIQVSADSESKSLSIVRVQSPAQFVEQQGSQLFFTFNKKQVFSFPDQNHYASEQIVAIFNNLTEMSQVQILIGINFVGSWQIDGQEFAPPNIIKKFN